MGADRRDEIMICAHTACIWEATSRKAGNVFPGSAYRDVEYLDFVLASGVILDSLSWSGRSIGNAVFHAVQMTSRVTRTNPNLGIILLLAPLSSTLSGLEDSPRAREFGAGRWELQQNLETLSGHDAKQVYKAIRLANPGGLGDAPEQDVREEPTVTLLEAMKLAANRDMVARQYANGFADVFDFGVPAFLAAFERFGCVEAGIIDSQLRWLAEYPDSFIARKNGPAVAEDVRKRAAKVLRLGGLATPEGRRAGVELDRHLRSDGNRLNPGTTADLITACLFVALRENRVQPSSPFRWDVPDWL